MAGLVIFPPLIGAFKASEAPRLQTPMSEASSENQCARKERNKHTDSLRKFVGHHPIMLSKVFPRGLCQKLSDS